LRFQPVERAQLVLELALSEPARDRRLEGVAVPARAAVVDLQDDEAAIGEVLPQEARVVVVEHRLHAGAPVDDHHRRMPSRRLKVAGLQERAVEERRIAARRDRHELGGPQVEVRDLGVLGHRDGADRCALGVVNRHARGPVVRRVDVDVAVLDMPALDGVYPGLEAAPRHAARREVDRVDGSFERRVAVREDERASAPVEADQVKHIERARRGLSHERSTPLIEDDEVTSALVRPQREEATVAERDVLRHRGPRCVVVPREHASLSRIEVQLHEREVTLVARQSLKIERLAVGRPHHPAEVAGLVLEGWREREVEPADVAAALG
jgi:hypothetical protein